MCTFRSADHLCVFTWDHQTISVMLPFTLWWRNSVSSKSHLYVLQVFFLVGVQLTRYFVSCTCGMWVCDSRKHKKQELASFNIWCFFSLFFFCFFFLSVATTNTSKIFRVGSPHLRLLLYKWHRFEGIWEDDEIWYNTAFIIRLCTQYPVCNKPSKQSKPDIISSSHRLCRKCFEPDVPGVLRLQRRRQPAHLLDEGGEVHRGLGWRESSGKRHQVRNTAGVLGPLIWWDNNEELIAYVEKFSGKTVKADTNGLFSPLTPNCIKQLFTRVLGVFLCCLQNKYWFYYFLFAYLVVQFCFKIVIHMVIYLSIQTVTENLCCT